MILNSIYAILKEYNNPSWSKEKIKNISHCNPTTQKRLEDIFRNSGFDIESISSKTLYNFQKSRVNFFQKHPISYRNIFGAAKVKKSKI